MSIRVDLENAPSFYTNLDTIAGSVTLNLNRPEQVGSIVVKLEGEAVTRPQVRDVWGPPGSDPRQQRRDESLANSTIASEAHKILYKIQQVFPDDYHASQASPYGAFPLQQGSHTFPFRFKVPINNLCSDQEAMMSLGQANMGNAGLFGSRGARFMDGTRQLYLRHVTQTLPPSFRNGNDEADVRYYIKVTVQRPGLLKENWRYLVHFKFMPIEPPRAAPSGQEAYARRPFTFQPALLKQRASSSTSFLSKFKGDSKSPNPDETKQQDAQSLEVSARLPHPPILTCNKPLPLRIITKRLVRNDEPVFMTALQVHLVGSTSARAQNAVSERTNRWVVLSVQDLNVPATSASKPGVDDEFVLPDDVWKTRALPNTIPPSFICCNITQRYSLQLTVSLRLGSAKVATAETITLPLNFSAVDVYSGVTPPPELLNAAKSKTSTGAAQARPPQLPPRQSNASGPSQNAGPSPLQPPRPQRPPQQQQQQQQQVVQPLQPQGGTTADEFLEPPPSYSEAMATGASSPYDGSERPPYSGVAEAEGSGPLPPGKN